MAHQLYSEASRAFILQDFGRTRQLLTDLSVGTLRHDGSGGVGGAGAGAQDADLARKVWILEITLLSSTAADNDEASKVSILEDLYNRIKRYYATSSTHGMSTADSADEAPLHPSLIVAFSLTGIKLGLPGYSRRILDEYFEVLLYTPQVELMPSHHSLSSVPFSATNGDISVSDIALPPPTLDASSSNNVPVWDKALHRLARVYAVLILGKAFQEWAAARHWAQQQSDETAGVQLVTHETFRELLNEIDAAQEAYEREQAELELDKARQAELNKNLAKDQRNSGSSSSVYATAARKARGSPTSNASKSKITATGASITGASVTSSDQHSATNRIAHGSSTTPRTVNGESPQSGFASVRDRISAALPSAPDSLTSRPPHTSFSILTMTKTYVRRLTESRLLSGVLIFFVILAFWRRRARLQTSKRRAQFADLFSRMRDKIVETIKMGGSLGVV